MTEAERTALVASKAWTLGIRSDGQHCVWDSSGSQVGLGSDPDVAVAAAIEASRPLVGGLGEDEEE